MAGVICQNILTTEHSVLCKQVSSGGLASLAVTNMHEPTDVLQLIGRAV